VGQRVRGDSRTRFRSCTLLKGHCYAVQSRVAVRRKISCLPSVCDFLADCQIVVRKVSVTGTLPCVGWTCIGQGYGKDADRVPQSVQMAIQMRCGTRVEESRAVALAQILANSDTGRQAARQ